MADQDMAVLQSFIECFKRADREAGAAMLADDAVIVETAGMPHAGTYSGRAEIQRLWALMDELFVRHSPLEVSMHDAGEFVVVRQSGEFVGRRTGRTVVMPIVELWWTADGRISRIEGYYHDPAALNDIV